MCYDAGMDIGSVISTGSGLDQAVVALKSAIEQQQVVLQLLQQASQGSLSSGNVTAARGNALNLLA